MKTRLLILALLLLSDLPVVFAQGMRELPANYPYPPSAWSPYLVGGLIGLLAILTMSLSKKIVGASSAYADAAGLIGRLIAPSHILKSAYYQQSINQRSAGHCCSCSVLSVAPFGQLGVGEN